MLLSIRQSTSIGLVVLQLHRIHHWLSFLILVELLLVVAPLGGVGILALSIAIGHQVLVVVVKVVL
jgi:hypothetical protein